MGQTWVRVPRGPLLLPFQDFFCEWPTHPSFGSVINATILVPSDPSLSLVGTTRWTHSERGGGWFCATSGAHARACQGSTQPGARDHMRLAVRRLTAAHYHRMRLPAGSTLLRIRALPAPVDKLHSGCRSPRAVRIGEEGFAGILRSGSKLTSAYYLTLPLVAACSCA